MSSENFFSFKVKNAKGTQEDLGSYKGKAVLVVNVASKCGFTPQYEGLEQLYKDYKDKGLMIVGFPCNQFGAQEPGSDAEVQDFCKMNFGVSFPVMAKIDVNGDEADPLYKWLKSSAPGILGTEAIKWNFTKFLIGKDGQVIERFAPTTKPKELTASIESAIG
jgi:glutathione peroxidase